MLLCHRLVADPGLAETLTQDTFVRTWQKLHLFRGEAKFTSWLHRLAVNVVIENLSGSPAGRSAAGSSCGKQVAT